MHTIICHIIDASPPGPRFGFKLREVRSDNEYIVEVDNQDQHALHTNLWRKFVEVEAVIDGDRLISMVEVQS